MNPKGEMKGNILVFEQKNIDHLRSKYDHMKKKKIKTCLYFIQVALFNYYVFKPISEFSVIVGSAITGPIGKECADLWPRIASAANAIV